MQISVNSKPILQNSSPMVSAQTAVQSKKFHLFFDALATVKGPEQLENNDGLGVDENQQASLQSLLHALTSEENALASLSSDQMEDKTVPEEEDIVNYLLTKLDGEPEAMTSDQISEKVYTNVEQRLYQFLSTFNFEQINENMFADTDFPDLVNTVKVLQIAGKETMDSSKAEEITDAVKALTDLVVSLINLTSMAEQEKVSNTSSNEKKKGMFTSDISQFVNKKINAAVIKEKHVAIPDNYSSTLDDEKVNILEENKLNGEEQQPFIETPKALQGNADVLRKQSNISELLENVQLVKELGAASEKKNEITTSTLIVQKDNKLVNDQNEQNLAWFNKKSDEVDVKINKSEKVTVQKDIQDVLSSIIMIVKEELGSTETNEVQKDKPENAEFNSLHKKDQGKELEISLDSVTVMELMDWIIQNGIDKNSKQQLTEIETERSNKKIEKLDDSLKNSLKVATVNELVDWIVQNSKQPSNNPEANKKQTEHPEYQPRKSLDSVTVSKLMDYIEGFAAEEILVPKMGENAWESPTINEVEHQQIPPTVVNETIAQQTRNVDSSKAVFTNYFPSTPFSADDQINNGANQNRKNNAAFKNEKDASDSSLSLKSLVSRIVENLETTNKTTEKPTVMYQKLLNPLLVESLKKKEVTTDSPVLQQDFVVEKSESEKKPLISVGQLQTPFPIKQQPLLVLSTNGSPISSNQLEAQLNKILSNASYITNGDSQKFTLRLAPEHLGSIRIEVYQNEGIVTAKILTATAEAKEMLDSHLSSLKHGLSSQNMVVDKMEIAFSPPGQQEKANKDQQSHQQQQQQQRQEQSANQEQNKQKKSFLEELLNMEL
ncbi:MAG: flagellar hook-length control protein FliK [Bacillus sp. (in: firmicutes)]